MVLKIIKFLFIVSCLYYYGCAEQSTSTGNESLSAEDSLVQIEGDSFSYPIQEEVYVPIYSDIYNKTKNFRYGLTATLSIRNTSKTDSVFLKNVDYYDTKGTFVRTYLKKPIYVRPFETVEYIIREKDTLGGSGASFHITWGANHKVNPIFQAVMIGSFNNALFAFTTEGTTISKRDE